MYFLKFMEQNLELNISMGIQYALVFVWKYYTVVVHIHLLMKCEAASLWCISFELCSLNWQSIDIFSILTHTVMHVP